MLYEYSEVARPCAGNVDYLDRVVVFTEQQLNVTAPMRLRYSWLIDDDTMLPALFEPETADWAVGAHAISNSPALVHEIVHLVSGRGTAPFFREGLAVAYGVLPPNGIAQRYWSDITFDPRRTMASSTSEEVEYGEAGLFVSFLLTRHGPAKFRSFTTRILRPYSMAHIRSAFRSAYSVDLDDEVEIFMAGPPPCGTDSFTIQVDDCSAPLLGWENGKLTVSDSLNCESDGVVGGIGPTFGYASFRQFTFEISVPGLYELETSGDDDVWIRWGPCFGCVWDDPNSWLRQGEARNLELAAGTYYVRLSGDSSRSPVSEVVLRPR